jgi:hypothetical protein
MAQSFRKRATREAKKLQEQIRRQTIRDLRQQIQAAQVRKRKALADVRRQCRASRVRVRAAVKLYRASERERLRREIAELRTAARQKCQRRLARVRELGSGKIEQRKAEKAARERLDRELQAVEGRLRKRRETSKRSHREESDDEVRSNLEAELVPVWNRIRRSVKGTPWISRTEAFLQWVEENPEEVVHFQQIEAEAATERLIKQLQEQERQATGTDEEPPF